MAWPKNRGSRSELMTQNRRLEGMVMATSVGLALVDEQGSLVTVNDALSAMLGYTRAEGQYVFGHHASRRPRGQPALVCRGARLSRPSLSSKSAMSRAMAR